MESLKETLSRRFCEACNGKLDDLDDSKRRAVIDSAGACAAVNEIVQVLDVICLWGNLELEASLHE